MLARKVALMTLTSVGWMMVKAKASTAPKLAVAAWTVAFSGYSFAYQLVRADAMADLQTVHHTQSTYWHAYALMLPR